MRRNLEINLKSNLGPASWAALTQTSSESAQMKSFWAFFSSVTPVAVVAVSSVAVAVVAVVLLSWFAWRTLKLEYLRETWINENCTLTNCPLGPVTFTALSFPFSWFISRSNSTFSPSAKLRKPSAWIADWWTKRSSLPLSGVINPNPFCPSKNLQKPVWTHTTLLQDFWLKRPDSLKTWQPFRCFNWVASDSRKANFSRTKINVSQAIQKIVHHSVFLAAPSLKALLHQAWRICFLAFSLAGREYSASQNSPPKSYCPSKRAAEKAGVIWKMTQNERVKFCSAQNFLVQKVDIERFTLFFALLNLKIGSAEPPKQLPKQLLLFVVAEPSEKRRWSNASLKAPQFPFFQRIHQETWRIHW